MDPAETADRCGIGIRGVAMAVDTVVWVALAFVVGAVVGAATGQLTTASGEVTVNLEGANAVAWLVLWLGAAIGYHTLLEWRVGKTLGKYLVRIRVVGDDGSPPTLRASLVRNLLRLVDWLPALYVVGVAVVAASDERKRLGDRVTDTVVVQSCRVAVERS